jgi:hypothetical protein
MNGGEMGAGIGFDTPEPQQPPDAQQNNAPEARQVRAWAAQEHAPPAERLALLPPDDFEGSVKHPFRTIDRDSYLEAIQGVGVAKLSRTAPVALVNLSDLIGIQGTVSRERVGHHLTDPQLYAPGARAPGHGMLVDRPVVVRKNGQLFIHDGHHRLTAQSLRGLSTAKVRFVDLDGAK